MTRPRAPEPPEDGPFPVNIGNVSSITNLGIRSSNRRISVNIIPEDLEKTHVPAKNNNRGFPIIPPWLFGKTYN